MVMLRLMNNWISYVNIIICSWSSPISPSSCDQNQTMRPSLLRKLWQSKGIYFGDGVANRGWLLMWKLSARRPLSIFRRSVPGQSEDSFDDAHHLNDGLETLNVMDDTWHPFCKVLGQLSAPDEWPKWSYCHAKSIEALYWGDHGTRGLCWKFNVTYFEDAQLHGSMYAPDSVIIPIFHNWCRRILSYYKSWPLQQIQDSYICPVCGLSGILSLSYSCIRLIIIGCLFQPFWLFARGKFNTHSVIFLWGTPNRRCARL